MDPLTDTHGRTVLVTEIGAARLSPRLVAS